MKLKLHTQIFIALIFGIFTGIFFQGITPVLIAPVGQVFMRLLKLLVIPVVFTSVTLAIISIGDLKHLGSISKKAFVYFLSTGFIATSLGLFLANLIKPGVSSGITTHGLKILAEKPPSVTDIFVTIAPQNIFESLSKGEILPVIIFSILLGMALLKIKEKAKPVISFFDSCYEAVMQITHWIISLTPIGVFALSANIVATLGISSLLNVVSYFLTVLLGLSIHAVIVLPLVLKVFGKYSPVALVKNLIPALAIAAPTASGAAAMPVTMECLNKSVGVPKKITSFVVSLGTTIDMNGTALYQGVAVMFIAQMYGIHLALFQQGLIVVTAFLASAGAAAVPGAGLVTMVIILNAVGVPIEGLALILPVDRILDSCRTTVNLWSNSIGTLVVARLENEELKPHKNLESEVEKELEELLHDDITSSEKRIKELEAELNRERDVVSKVK